MNLGAIIRYEQGILEEDTRTTPIYATCTCHAQSDTSARELLHKNFSNVHVPSYADWSQNFNKYNSVFRSQMYNRHVKVGVQTYYIQNKDMHTTHTIHYRKTGSLLPSSGKILG